jgi:dTDP-4-dehydrorhamnose reductase
MDITCADSVERALAQHQPWAVINTAGYVRVDEAENDVERCMRENAIGPAILAAACARHGVHLTSFSSDLVFDGKQETPYLESSATAPLNVYGRSKAEAEQRALDKHPGALIVRTSAFFGPWDKHNFVTLALQALERGETFTAAGDLTVSPTYVPDLVHTCLDLAIDGESGIWHLANAGAVTWAGLAEKAAQAAGVDASRLEAKPASACGFTAARPGYAALSSERGILLPALDNALTRYLELRRQGDPEMDELIRAMETRQPLAGEQRQMPEAAPEAFQAKRS